MKVDMDGWDEIDLAVERYEQNNRFIKFFRDERDKGRDRFERQRAAGIARWMLSDFAGNQRRELADIIDDLESWV